MRILITTDWYSPVVNGVVTSVLNLEKELRDRGHDVKVLTLSLDGKSHHTDHVYYIKSYDAGRVYPQARCTATLNGSEIKEILEWEPEVIHSHCEFTTFLLAKKIASKCNIPIIHTYHTLYEDYTHYIVKNEVIGKKIVSFLSKTILDKTQAVIVPTGKIKGVLNQYKVNSETHVVPTGICLEQYNEPLSNEERIAMKAELGIKSNCTVLVTVGRLAKEKNTSFLIKAMKELNRNDLVLLVVGDGPYRAELEKLTAELNLEEQVIFTGMVKPKEVHKYFKLGDIFVSASTSETQGLTYIEALASGLPSVCQKDLCIKDVIKNNYNGYQFEDLFSYQQYITDLIDHPNKIELLKGNAKASVTKYSTGNYAAEVERLYYETAQNYQRTLAQRNIFAFGNLIINNKAG